MTATALRLIIHGAIQADEIVTPVLKFSDDLPAEYAKTTSAPETSIKLGVEYA
jgi:hypothetical protein